MERSLLYQINTRVLLQELGAALGRPAALEDIPDSTLEGLAAQGIEWVWLLGVWQTGTVGPNVSRTRTELRAACMECLPDLREEDICGSPFAIRSYTVHRDLGGDSALTGLRQRMKEHGLRLLLDFVPNHVAPDHPWVDEHSEFFVRGTEEALAREPQNFVRLRSKRGELILAHGRDPHFAGWLDTVQMNYRHQAARQAMSGELSRI
ncbi:MAG TPA: alpha-amylase family glycosyl hydrolase, partial [Clostridia bacterium]|nr:alpha-amylase family glycosyl hydrolase [Clostridia bacterium]